MSPSPAPEASRAFSFGPFRLHNAQKQLSENGVTVRLGSRALELLFALVERSGEVLSRQELEARVWPRTVVEETSLRVHIAALRKALRDGVDGARYITNIPGRGYCFVAPVQVHADALQPVAAIALAANRALNNLPARLTTVVGRVADIRAVADHLRMRRLVSITGPGGIGKTTVALATAAENIASYEHGAVFVDFAPLTAAALVPATVALALGSQPTSGSPLPQVCEFLRKRRMLIVLDNCEHVLGAAAHLVESVMREAPEIHILTTTREPLFVEEEWVYRIAALDAPLNEDDLTDAQVMSYAAVRLFAERAEANSDDFALTPETLPAVRQLCHRLDGIPLAIELAAARVGSLGVQALAQRLDDLFQLLSRGRRTAMPRHQTLEALLDWSHDLLTEPEQIVLRRLSVFRSSFSLDAAVSVAATNGIDASTVIASVSSLAIKSLVTADITGKATQFRLLYMTRVYALRKLADSGEMNHLRRRHAEHLLSTGKAMSHLWGVEQAERFTTYGLLIDDARAAMDWAFSPEGDDLLGAQVTTAAWIATLGLGLFGEFRARIEHALDCVSRLDPPQPGLELTLSICWCFMSGQMPGMGGKQQAETFARVRALAANTDDITLKAEALYALAVGAMGQGRYSEVKQLVAELKSTVTSDMQPLSVLVGDRFLVLAHHYLGDHARARVLARRVLTYHAEPQHEWFIGQVPRSVSMVIIEARILWLEGASDRAIGLARQAVENALGGHPFALCHALAMAAIPIAFWRGDREQAQELTQALLDHAIRHSLPYWQSWGEGYRRIHDQGLDERPEDGEVAHPWATNPMELDMLATMSPGLATSTTIERVNQGLVAWCGPEILRAQALQMLHAQTEGASEQAVATLMRALAMAREQGALAWELRVASTLASLAPRIEGLEMHAPLTEVLSRVKEGLQTRDVMRARRLLEMLEDRLPTRTGRVRA